MQNYITRSIKFLTKRLLCTFVYLTKNITSHLNMKYILPIIVICNFLKIVIASVCLWNSGCPYNYFSTKTPYGAVRGDIRDSKIKVKGCEPLSIWGLFRHGKTNPGYDTAKNMERVISIRNDIFLSYKNGKCSLCAQDIDNLRNWSTDIDIFDSPYSLNHKGYNEMVGIGKRLKQAFPKLLDNLKDGSYIFRPAIGTEMEDSAKGFVDGLENKKLIIERPKKNVDVMIPYAECGQYQRILENKTNTFIETNKYLKSSDYLLVKDRIQRRIGLEYTLSDEDVLAIYDLCRYTSSGFESSPSPWCALFTTEDLQVLEYIKDLNNYYTDSYGMPMNEIFGRIPLKDLYTKFEAAKTGREKIVAYFGHSKIISMVYNALGAFEDKTFTAAHRNHNRNWRSSKLAAFSANFIAVLNRCLIDSTENYNVVFYSNEEPLRFICPDGICTWQEFEDKMKPYLNTTIDFCD
ncbi:LOW QUALITY PROTEIN: multiple inositol polyphosphate phosphatase 1-like [Aphomia sociella]